MIRKLTLRSKTIFQIQYFGWPDHGVPVNLTSFFDFVIKCEELIAFHKGTVIVHCRY